MSNISNFDILFNVLLLMAGLLALVGVLRALGASNAAVCKIVLFEGAVVGLISWMLGALVAFPLGHVFANAVSVAMLRTKVTVQSGVVRSRQEVNGCGFLTWQPGRGILGRRKKSSDTCYGEPEGVECLWSKHSTPGE